MSLVCQCPAATAITSPGNMTCPENFGQIQKVALTRLVLADGTKNKFTGTTGTPPVDTIKLLASWSTKLSAATAEKIVVTPYINAPADSGGDPRLTSGGNDDLGGIQEVLGGEPVQFTGQLRSVPQSIAKALRELACEANVGNLGVFLFDENGRIEAIQDASDADTYYPIPIRGFYVGSKIHGNYDAKDYNQIQWSYPDNYSDGLVIITPSDFNPLTDLQNS